MPEEENLEYGYQFSNRKIGLIGLFGALLLFGYDCMNGVGERIGYLLPAIWALIFGFALLATFFCARYIEGIKTTGWRVVIGLSILSVFAVAAVHLSREMMLDFYPPLDPAHTNLTDEEFSDYLKKRLSYYTRFNTTYIFVGISIMGPHSKDRQASKRKPEPSVGRPQPPENDWWSKYN